jgi:secondary thiamine-phosphate synthase enzyme
MAQGGFDMPVCTERIELRTHGDAEMIDITEQIRSRITSSGLRNGIACVFVPGSTGGLTTIEYESGCVMDLQRLFDRTAPRNIEYEHHRRWGDGNGHSHVRAALLGASLSIPFVDGEPTLGTWQQVIFVDFDNKSRSRRLVVQLVGE